MQDLGYEYLSAATKEEYLEKAERFLTPELTEKPMVFEIFTDSTDESDAIYAMDHIVKDSKGIAKEMIKSIAGEKGVSAVKRLLKR